MLEEKFLKKLYMDRCFHLVRWKNEKEVLVEREGFSCGLITVEFVGGEFNLIIERHYFSSGNLKCEIFYSNGRYNGKIKMYNESENIKTMTWGADSYEAA